MFFNAPSNPTPAKHVIYLCTTVLLGILLSLIVHIIAETLYLSWATSRHHDIVWRWGCALHPAIQIGLPLLGAIGGYFLGRMWWQWVYIDRKWAHGVGRQPKNNQPT